MRVQVEISPGELIDKLTITKIKLDKITDETKLAHIAAVQQRLAA